MDWDDLQPRPRASAITLGESLESLSVSELEARLEALAREAERVRAEMQTKKAHEAAAAAVFKR